MSRAEVEARFEAEYLALCDAWHRADRTWNPNRSRELIRHRGGAGAASRLLEKFGTTPGFERLRRLGRLDLTVEALVLRPEFGGLFTPMERSIARQRLVEAGVARSALPMEPYERIS